MTKKDYVKIAAAVRRSQLNEEGEDVTLALIRLADDLAGLFILDNPRFDRGRFLVACGLA